MDANADELENVRATQSSQFHFRSFAAITGSLLLMCRRCRQPGWAGFQVAAFWLQ
jgi:hypothetical protein